MAKQTSGRRFRIQQAVVWNLVDAAGTPQGQAACFHQWVPLVVPG